MSLKDSTVSNKKRGNKMQLELKDVCAPGYLNDHTGYLINILFNYPAKLEDIKEQIQEEINGSTSIPSHWSEPTNDNLEEISQEILNEFALIWSSEDVDDNEKDELYNEVYAYIEIIERNILPDWLCTQLIERYNAEVSAGATIDINPHLPYIALKMSDNSEYYFQGDEAEELLDSVPENIQEEEFIVAIAQDW